MTKKPDLEYTGIAKNGPFSLIAAFSATFDQESRLVLGLEESGLKEDALNDPASITACYTQHFNLSAETVSRAAQALQQTERDISDGKIAMEAIPDWMDLTGPAPEKKLYQPKEVKL